MTKELQFLRYNTPQEAERIYYRAVLIIKFSDKIDFVTC
jgi:hypothetical protein